LERFLRTSNGLTLHLLGTLSEAIGAFAEEFEEAEVAEDLELLADFVADVGVIGMKFGQSVGVSVNIGESEVDFDQGLHYLKHVKSPASFFYP